VQTSPQQFERREVTLGLSDGLTVEVLGGVLIEDSIKRWNQPIFE
jgi:HlyD family secretion protein